MTGVPSLKAMLFTDTARLSSHILLIMALRPICKNTVYCQALQGLKEKGIRAWPFISCMQLSIQLGAAGATSVCIVCYVIPVALHLKLYLSKSGYQLLEAAESPKLAEPLIPAIPCSIRLLLLHCPATEKGMPEHISFCLLHLEAQTGCGKGVE